MRERSLTNTMNSRGPSTDPYGTPKDTTPTFEKADPTPPVVDILL